MARMSKEEQKVIGWVVAGLMILGASILIARQLFPIFLVLSIISFIALIFCGVKDIFFRDDWEDNYWSFYVLIVFGVIIFGFLITWFIGYGIGGTSIGEASVDFYVTITGAEQEIIDTFQESINQIVKEGCETLPEESCHILRQTAESAETIQEVADIAENLKKTSDIVQKVN